MSETVWRRHCLVLLLAQLVITGTWGTSTKESLATSSSETSSPLMSPFYTSSKALSHYTSPYHTTSQSSNQTFSSPYHSTIITSSLTALSSLYSSPESNFTQTSAIVFQSPSSKPEPASEDQNFRLLLYIVPPLSFIVVIVISIFLVLCIRRYRKHRRYRHHLHMPLEELDSSSEGSGSFDGNNDEMNEQESREAAFVVTHSNRQQTQPILAFQEDT